MRGQVAKKHTTSAASMADWPSLPTHSSTGAPQPIVLPLHQTANINVLNSIPSTTHQMSQRAPAKSSSFLGAAGIQLRDRKRWFYNQKLI